MKTIGYRDLADGSRRIKIFYNRNKQQTRQERIMAALEELKGVGNIAIYLINGNKYRRILTKRI
ncbi:MAG: hypothetical protein WDA59_07180 [Methanofastidiosum sp.]